MTESKNAMTKAIEKSISERLEEQGEDGLPRGWKTGLAARLEIRLSLVMYGGISLAVYLSGVSKELLSIVRATARCAFDDVITLHGDGERRLEPNKASYRVDWDDLTPVEQVYRRIAATAGPNGEPVEVVVDVLSGTSAGGLNSIFLGRALARGGTLDPLDDIWYDHADFANLVTGGRPKDLGRSSNSEDSRGPSDDKRRSLVNNEYFWATIKQALDDAGQPQSDRLVDQIDCFVTATDVRGIEEQITLGADADTGITELRRQAVFHLRDAVADPARLMNTIPIDDLSCDDPFELAFAGRVTSALPLVFDPVQWQDRRIQDGGLLKDYERGAKAALSHLKTTSPVRDNHEIQQRWFTDGGLTDNKPFSYAISVPAGRTAVLPVDRKLLYMEPNPTRGFEGASIDQRPTLADLFPLAGAKGKENIQADLERLADRNARIRAKLQQVEFFRTRPLAHVILSLRTAISGGIEDYSEEHLAAGLVEPLSSEHHRRVESASNAPEGITLTAEELAAVGWFALFGYDRIVAKWKQTTAEAGVKEDDGWGVGAREGLRWTQVIAAILAGSRGTSRPIDKELIAERASELGPAVQAALGSDDNDGLADVRSCLAKLDWSYRFRRFSLVEHLLSQAQRDLSKQRSAKRTSTDGGDLAANKRRFNRYSRLRSRLATHTVELQAGVDQALRVARLVGASHDVRDRDFAHAVSTLAEELQAPFGVASRQPRLDLLLALQEAADDGDGQACELIVRVIDAWFNFDKYDSVTMQPHDDADGELEPTGIVRVSPIDATYFVDESRKDLNGPVRKLGGATLANIGGFFARDWRLNDLTWGRFDMAEILIREIVSDGEAREGAIRSVTDEILVELAKDADRDPLGAMLRVNRFPGSDLHERAVDALEDRDKPEVDDPEAAAESVAGAFRDLLHSSDAADAWNVQMDLNEVDSERKHESVDEATEELVRIVRDSGTRPSTLIAAESLELAASAAVGRSDSRNRSWFLRVVATVLAVVLAVVAFSTAAAASLISFVAAAISTAVFAWQVRTRVRDRQPVRPAVPIAVAVFVAIAAAALIFGIARVGLSNAGTHIGAAVMVIAALLLLGLTGVSVAARRAMRAAYAKFGTPRAEH